MDHSLEDEASNVQDESTRYTSQPRRETHRPEGYSDETRREEPRTELHERQSPIVKQHETYPLLREQTASSHREESSRRTHDYSTRNENYTNGSRNDGVRFTTQRNSEHQNEDEEGSLGFQSKTVTRSGGGRENASGTYEARKLVLRDYHQDDDRRSNPSKPEQRAPTVSYTTAPIRRSVPTNPRSCVIDINITVSFNGQSPQALVNTRNVTSTSPPIRSTAVLDNVRFVDIDFRSPQRTAKLSTDGNIHVSPSKQSSTFSNENRK